MSYSLQNAVANYLLRLNSCGFRKLCRNCKTQHTLGAFLSLPFPRGGGEGCGMYWRNCHCGSTLALEITMVQDVLRKEGN